MKHLKHSQIAHLDRALESRNRELRAEIRVLLLQSDEEHHRDLADMVGDVGDESVANLLADLDAAFIDRHVRGVRCFACGSRHEKAHIHGGALTL